MGTAFPPTPRLLRNRMLKIQDEGYPQPTHLLLLAHTLCAQDDATEEQIKKSFRRLALKLHPDKVALSGALSDEQKAQSELRFKQINEAYSVLSDPSRRAKYDAYGDEALEDPDNMPPPPPPGSGGPRRRRGGNRGGQAYEDFSDISVEELLAATLNLRRRRYSLMTEEPFAVALLQIVLPVAVMVALAVNPPNSSPSMYAGTRHPPFAMSSDDLYSVERTTASGSVPYFVRTDFAATFGADSGVLAAVEAAAEGLHRESLRSECDAQRRKWQASVDRARRMPKGPERDAKVAAAQKLPTPGCDLLLRAHGEERSVAEAFAARSAGGWSGVAWKLQQQTQAPQQATAPPTIATAA